MTRELQREIQAMAVECDDTYAMANSIEDMLEEIFDDHEAELEEVQETIKNLKHNYDVQVEYNNTAYKNYINMVNSLEKRIAELEALQSRSCEGCKHYKFTYNSNDGAVRQLMTICSDCFRRLNRDRYEPKEQ